MFKAFLLLALFSFLFLPSVASGSYTSVTVSEAKAMIDSDPALIILDVRTQSEFDSKHIGNARLIPLAELEGGLNELNKTSGILVYCDSGSRSAAASQLLADDGFLHVYNLADGMASWVAAGYPAFVKYSSVQKAINEAVEGDSILISSGLYYEHLVINKSISLIGENMDTTIVDGNYSGNVMNVTSRGTTVSKFTVRKSGVAGSNCGLYVDGVDSAVSISDNIVTQNYVGILLFNSTNCTISNNTIFLNGDDGIRLKDSSNNMIESNRIFSNTFYGISLHGSNFNAVSENAVSNNAYGLLANLRSGNNTILENIFSSNAYSGIGLYWYSDNNAIFRNIVANSSIGIDVQQFSTSNLAFDNNLYSNGYGIWLSRAISNSFLHNNFVDNIQQVYGYGFSTAAWDNGLEGNYWSSYIGSDVDRDGLGDTSLLLASGNVDNHPLMGTFRSFSTPLGYRVDVVSNSTIGNFQFFESNGTIKIHVFNMTAFQDFGFCRVRMPHALMNQTYIVLVDGAEPFFANYSLFDDGKSRWIYFSYRHSGLEILILPEFGSLLLLLLLIKEAVLASVFHRRRSVEFRKVFGIV